VPAMERLVAALPKARGLQSFIAQAGLNWTVSHLMLTSSALGGFTYFGLAMLAHQPGLFAAVAGLLAAMLPFLLVQRCRARRLARIEHQLPDALDLMIRALRSGHAFSSALQMVGDEMPEPVANEFRIVHDEVSFGVSLQQALINLSRRVPLTDVRYFVVAVLIQRESGGNLTEVLGNLSRLVRDRLKFNAKVRVLSSEGRMSAWVLGVMPFALAGVMNLVNPDFMSLMWTDPIGIAILQYLFILMVAGIIMLKRIIRIRV
ncbi:MAG TPA: type II secretion system F family protein, partial [Noviherbaspirillum sp.]|nr:type II secretion system F family protein [Noviherbaspirillum sp.]